MKQKKLIAGVLFLAMLFVAPVAASAADNGTDNGTAYGCYLLNQSAVYTTTLTFQPEFQLEMSGVFENGTGLYFISSGLFVGIYWALDVEDIAVAPTDVIIVLIGTASQDFIAGAGIMLVDYVAPSGLVFFGSAVTPEAL